MLKAVMHIGICSSMFLSIGCYSPIKRRHKGSKPNGEDGAGCAGFGYWAASWPATLALGAGFLGFVQTTSTTFSPWASASMMAGSWGSNH